MSTLILGSEEGTVDTGLPGATANFPMTSFLNPAYRRLGENRIALLRGSTPLEKPSWNDLMFSHGDTYDRNHRNPGVNRGFRSAAFMQDAMNGKNADPALCGDAAVNMTDYQGLGKTATGPASVYVPGCYLPGVAGQWVYAAGAATGVGINCMPFHNSSNGPWVAINVTGTTEMIRMWRTAATQWRIELVVASVVTLEVNIVTNITLDINNSSAFGMRRDGDRLRAFANGRMLADFTLSAAAIALTGTDTAMQAIYNMNTVADNFEVFTGL